jgi:hypothetical protein
MNKSHTINQAAFSGDLDPMDLDLVASGQSDLHLVAPGQPDFSGQHSFQNLLEDISTDDNSDIPMMVGFCLPFIYFRMDPLR